MTETSEGDHENMNHSNVPTSGRSNRSDTGGVTHLWFLLDRSGSMASIRHDVVSGFDAFFATQAQNPANTVVSLVHFDSCDPYEKLFHRLPIARVRSIGRRFSPRGTTPLFDAIGMLLDDAERGAGDIDRLVVILTDGHENASVRWSRRVLFERISRLRRAGWTFVFLGANQDAYATGRGLGFADGSVTNFSGDGAGARSVCGSLGRATSEWRNKPREVRHRDEDRFFGSSKEAEIEMASRREGR